MSVNRYTNLDFNQPVSGRVPMPLDFIYRAGLQKQKDYEDATEQTYKLNDLMATVNAIDAHQPYKKALSDKYHPQIEAIADRIVNSGDMTAKRDLNKIARQWQNDPIRQELEQSYNNYKLYQQDKIKKGEKYAEWHDPSLGFQGQGEAGPNPFRYTGMGERTDHQKRAHDMMAGIAEDAAKSAGYKLNPDGTIVKGGSGSEHIFTTKVAELANMKAMDFLTTSEGQDYAKQLQYNNPGLQNKDLIANAAKYLYDAGANQIFKKTESQSDISFSPIYDDLHKEHAANSLTTTTQSEGIATGIGHPTTKEMEFDSKGNLVIPTKQVPIKIGVTDEFGVYDPNKIQYKNEGKDLNKFAEQVKYIKEIQMNHPELKDLSPKETLEAVKKAYKAVETESIPLNSISNLAAKGIGEAIARNMGQRNFYIYDSKGKTIDGTRETVLDELGLTDVELQEQIKKNGVSGFTQAGPTPGGLYIDVKDKKDNTRRIIVSQDTEIQKIFSVSHAVNEARKTLTPTVLQPIPGVDYKVAVKPTITRSGYIKWEYMEIINGIPKPTTLNDIRKQEKEALKESNYLGSQIQNTKDEEKDIE